MIDGKFKHECETYSGLLIDETCIEFASCECFSGDEFIKAKAAAEDYGDEYMANHAKWVREGGALPDFGGEEWESTALSYEITASRSPTFRS